MFSIFKRKKSRAQNLENPAEVCNEYVRLVHYGAEDTFLDVDTSLVIEDRELLEAYIKSGKLSDAQLEKLKTTDALFKVKAKNCKLKYEALIESGAENADYLDMVLKGLHYPNITDSKRWWYHLVD